MNNTVVVLMFYINNSFNVLEKWKALKLLFFFILTITKIILNITKIILFTRLTITKIILNITKIIPTITHIDFFVIL